MENTDPATWCGSELNEGGPCTLPNDRHSFNAHVTQQDLAETFLPPFEQAVVSACIVVVYVACLRYLSERTNSGIFGGLNGAESACRCNHVQL